MGRLNFHETQILLETYRKKRIKDYKLVFPNLTNKSATKNTLQNSTKLILNSSSLLQDITNCEQSIRSSRQKTVSLAVAPETMFQKMKGLTNADLIDQVINACNIITQVIA